MKKGQNPVYEEIHYSESNHAISSKKPVRMLKWCLMGVRLGSQGWELTEGKEMTLLLDWKVCGWGFSVARQAQLEVGRCFEPELGHEQQKKRRNERKSLCGWDPKSRCRESCMSPHPMWEKRRTRWMRSVAAGCVGLLVGISCLGASVFSRM